MKNEIDLSIVDTRLYIPFRSPIAEIWGDQHVCGQLPIHLQVAPEFRRGRWLPHRAEGRIQGQARMEKEQRTLGLRGSYI